MRRLGQDASPVDLVAGCWQGPVKVG